MVASKASSRIARWLQMVTIVSTTVYASAFVSQQQQATTTFGISRSTQRQFTTNGIKPLKAATPSSSDCADLSDVGFVLLAGGTGSRMKAGMPKQFLELRGKPILHHSLDLFLEQLSEALGPEKAPKNVVLVMDPMYQPDYTEWVEKYDGKLALANPGIERQGSVENGLNKLIEMAGDSCTYVAVHDSARPLVSIQEILDVVSDAKETGAAVLGVPCKATIKESEDGVLVQRTIPRARLWEVHTPQGKYDCIKHSYLLQADIIWQQDR
jgi:2-C-methyl-D-erythritol 4-phosphate cytidylyltransferase